MITRHGIPYIEWGEIYVYSQNSGGSSERTGLGGRLLEPCVAAKTGTRSAYKSPGGL